MNLEPFHPSEDLAASLARNRAGRLTRGQRTAVTLAGVASSLAGLVVLLIMVSVFAAFFGGVRVTSDSPIAGLVSEIIGLFFLASFVYMLLTFYFNARWFLPDAFGRAPVATVRGPLQIRYAARQRPELPFSYIIGDYSFAPYVVPYDVPMQEGRTYVVYYARHSRMFLNIEPE
ncbi:MAG: hypothetical protein ACLFTK_11010 [Anaerolineales bacterium]